MKLTVQLSKALSVEIEGATQKKLFDALVEAEKLKEIFAPRCCGVCGCKDIGYNLREAKYTDDRGKEKTAFYPEIFCKNVYNEDESDNCGAKLPVHQNEIGETLYTTEKKNGKVLPNGGWSTKFRYRPYKPKDDEEGDKPAPNVSPKDKN
jgi:hypothetical protein